MYVAKGPGIVVDAWVANNFFANAEEQVEDTMRLWDEISLFELEHLFPMKQFRTTDSPRVAFLEAVARHIALCSL